MQRWKYRRTHLNLYSIVLYCNLCACCDAFLSRKSEEIEVLQVDQTLFIVGLVLGKV
jgi:hypothetical protein